jgi:cysteine-rich repeat protein
MRSVVRAIVVAVALTMVASGASWAVCGDGVLDAGEVCDDGNLADGDCCSAACVSAEDASPCDDARACTADDACIAGACMGVPSDDRCPLDLGRYVCWSARGPGFATKKGARVVDEFRAGGTGEALDVRGPSLLCGAATPDDAGRSVPPPSLLAHRARATRTKPRQKPLQRGMRVRHALGLVALTLKRPTSVLVPSGVAATPEDAVAPGPSVPLLACYGVKTAKPKKGEAAAPGAFVSGARITLSDLRGGPVEYVLGAPTSLCTTERQVKADGAAPPTSNPGYLVCHRAKARSRARATTLGAANALGAGAVKAKRAVAVCLPATLPRADAAAVGPAFPFLTESGAVPEAMKALWKGGFEAPHTSDAASAHDAAMDAAKGTILGDLPAAQDQLLRALKLLPTDDVDGHASLGGLLDVAGDADPIHDHLLEILESPPHGPELHPHQTPPDELTRLLLVDKLQGQALKGSKGALAVLFKAAGSADASTVQQAIRALYRIGGNRRLVQRELRKHVAPANTWLLYLE